MLREYLDKALESARYEVMEDGRYWGEIPIMPGVWAEGETIEQCRRELLEVAEDWVLVGIYHHDPLPVIADIDPNIKAEARAEAD